MHVLRGTGDRQLRRRDRGWTADRGVRFAGDDDVRQPPVDDERDAVACCLAFVTRSDARIIDPSAAAG